MAAINLKDFYAPQDIEDLITMKVDKASDEVFNSNTAHDFINECVGEITSKEDISAMDTIYAVAREIRNSSKIDNARQLLLFASLGKHFFNVIDGYEHRLGKRSLAQQMGISIEELTELENE